MIQLSANKPCDTYCLSVAARPNRIALALTMALMPALSFAQEAAVNEGGAARMLEEVQVTARRRTESQQDVPIAITAFSDEYLRFNKIDRISDLQFHAPGLTITQSGSASNLPVISLRGQRPTEVALHLEAAVPMYFAEVVMSPSHGTNIAMFDLENVQVLKGPQGTLFGRNSTGGALLLTPTRPGKQVGGYTQLTLGDYNHVETEAAFDLPASDRLSFRIAGKTINRDGYQKNVLTGDELWDENTASVRLSMLAEPTDTFENLLVASWDRADAKGRQPVLVAANADHPIGRMLVASAAEQELRNDPFRVASNLDNNFDDIESWFASNISTWDAGGIEVKNIFGYRKIESFEASDIDSSPLTIVQTPPGRDNMNEGEQLSNELQLQGQAWNDRLQWITGLYAYRMQGTRESASTIMPTRLTETNGDIENRSYALFLQGTYGLTDRLSLTLGGRRSWDEREMVIRHRGGTIGASGTSVFCNVRDANGDPLPLDRCSASADDSWSANTWLASLSYDVSDSTMLYGSVGTGFRAGGFDMRGGSGAQLVPFDEENVTSYEVGVKSDWNLGGVQVRSNIALYHQNYEDIQRTLAVASPDGGIFSTTANAAEAEIRGADVELSILPFDSLMITLNYAYVDAEYKSYIDSTATPPVDRSGERFRWIPENQVSATIRYTLPLDPAIGEVSLQANIYNQSNLMRSTNSPEVDDIYEAGTLIQGEYTLINYRMDWLTVMGSAFDLSLFVKNATDEEYTVSDVSALDSLGLAAFSYGAPRTWGASLRYSF